MEEFGRAREAWLQTFLELLRHRPTTFMVFGKLALCFRAFST